MTIPTGGAGGLAGGAGAGASNTDVAKAGAQKAGVGPGGGVGSPAARPGGDKPGTSHSAEAAPGGSSANDAVSTGAGGTSAAREPDANDGAVAKAKGSDLGKVAASGAAVPAAGAAGQLMFAMMLLNWLKSMFFAALAMAANLINMVIGAVLAVGKALVGGAMAAGAAVSSFVGGAISAVTGAVSVVVTGALVVGVGVTSVVAGGIGNDTARRDGGLFDCSVEIVAASDSVTPPPVGGNVEKTTDNAKLVYGVLSAWGMPDENIAGILGNWDAESGIDPTGVETISGEPFAVGPKKEDAEAKGFDVDKVDPSYGSRFPGVDLLGIGLGQWSNGRNTQLRDYAKGNGNSSWATLETQLGFMISKDSGAPVIKHMISTPIGSASEAATYFHHEWEKSADTSMTKREVAANKWFARMGGWEKNQSLADSILAQSGSTVEAANTNRVSDAKANCRTDTKTRTAGLKEGGLNLEEAKALMDTYKSEGDAVLAEAFGTGGPGDCGHGKSDNCVGFTAYFLYKFTSFKQYAPGNGIETAGSVARMNNRETSSTPAAYSVFSQPTGQPEGHTGVILGIQGDQAIIGEASCGTNHEGTRAYTRPLSDMEGWVFTDVSDLLTDKSLSS
jgi:hypothetical protein